MLAVTHDGAGRVYSFPDEDAISASAVEHDHWYRLSRALEKWRFDVFPCLSITDVK